VNLIQTLDIDGLCTWKCNAFEAGRCTRLGRRELMGLPRAVKHADGVRAYFQDAVGSIPSMPGLSTCIFGVADSD
jgi:hypothetical protein